MMNIHALIFLILIGFLFSCEGPLDKTSQVPFILDEKCLIYNQEQDNQIEGTYLFVEQIINDSTYQINLPSNFHLNTDSHNKWIMGWGNEQAYHDNGSENCAFINQINLSKKIIVLNKTLKGKGRPKAGQKVVFWNTKPNNFKPYQEKPIIEPSLWPKFLGESIGISKIIYDTKNQIWICFIYEVDTDINSIYIATSNDLIHWKAGNKGLPILQNTDFKQTKWANNKLGKTPFVSDIYFKEGRYFIFLDGINSIGKRSIGLIETKDLLAKSSYIIYSDPILKNGFKGRWNEASCFNAKICQTKVGFRMAFTGVDDKGTENIGIAQSTNLKDWTMLRSEAVINSHKGWRSKKESSEVCHFINKNDTLFLLVAGTKSFQNDWISKLQGKQFKGVPGNVDDAQLGLYYSTNFGQTFTAHSNNPVWINNYINPYENEHMGGNISIIETDSLTYIFTQIKTSFPSLKYSIYLKYKPKFE
jgi:hypothetical protein